MARAWQIGIVAATLFFATVLGQVAAAPPPDEIRRTLASEPESLDPHKTEGLIEFYIQQDLFEGLTVFGADGRVRPGSAQSWDLSPDGRIYTFHVRPGMVWSNGDPLTSADFVYSLRRAVDPATASPYSAVLAPIAGAAEIVAGTQKDITALGVEAPDPLTLRIRLTEPTAYFLALLTNQVAMPVHRKTVESFGTKWTQPGSIVTNGAFILKEWIPQAHLLLARNPRFHAVSDIAIPQIRWVIDADVMTGYRKFRSGEIDLASVPPSELKAAEAALGDNLHSLAYLGNQFLGFNLTRPPFAKNLKLRQALALALDERILNDKVIASRQISAYGIVPDGIDGYRQQSTFYRDMAMADRLARAKTLFAEAGYGPDNPLEIQLLYPTQPIYQKAYTAVAAMWKFGLGVKTKLVNREWQVYIAALRNKEFDIAAAGWIADYPDPETFLGQFRSAADDLNHIGYNDAVYDGLMAKAAATVDPSARLDVLSQAERHFLDAQPLIPLSFAVTHELVAARVKGWQANAMRQHPSRYLSIAAQP